MVVAIRTGQSPQVFGFTSRQARLLDLAAWADGTYYEGTMLNGGHLWPWDASTLSVEKYGIAINVPCHRRKPGIQVGLIEDKIERLMDMLVGEGRLPAFTGMGKALQTLLLDEIEFVDSIFLPAADLVIKGALCWGFAKIDDDSGSFFEPLYLDVTFCEPVFASQARSEMARVLSEEWADSGVPMHPPNDEDDYLWIPPGTRSDDLIALRYEYTWTDADTNQTHRERVDYLPDCIVYWRRKTEGSGGVADPWELAADVVPHNWGLVPLVWERERSAKPGLTEGKSYISEALQSVAKAADYAESLRGDSVKAICWPQLVLIDVIDNVKAAVREAQTQRQQQYVQGASSSVVLDFRSSSVSGKQGQVKILEPTGKGLEYAKEQIKDMKAHASRLSAIPDEDADKKGIGVVSGVALRKMSEPRINRVNKYRRQLTRAIRRLAHKLSIVAKVPLIEPAKEGEEGVERTDFMVQWPEIISSSPEDWKSIGDALKQLNGGQVTVSRQTAITKVANFLEISDPEAEVARVMAESAYPEVDAETASAVKVAKATPAPALPRPSNPE